MPHWGFPVFSEPSRGITFDSFCFSFLPLISLVLCISVSNTEVIHRFVRSKMHEMIGFLLTVSRLPALVKLNAHAGFFCCFFLTFLSKELHFPCTST